MRTAARRFGTALALALVGSFLMIAPASAERECLREGMVQQPDGSMVYGCVEWSAGSPGDSGGGSGGGGDTAPACTFRGSIYNEFCIGDRACFMNDPAAYQDVEAIRERGGTISDKPDDADHIIHVGCIGPDDTEYENWYWDSEFETVSVRDRLVAAYGRIVLPDVTPVFNPPNRTLVNLETWFWAQGASATPVVGSEALGLVAIAEPRAMVVTAAGQSVTCPVVTSRSDACSMTFSRAGTHTASMRITYDIRFELDGSPFTVPPGNEQFLTMESTDSVTVPVIEVQSLVTELG
ncbi:hypothetical protein GL325_01600 [Aeromicrobium sp. 636]|uniref:Uncharacterized protein n=1 Tax=Aeromicrobium senzhongii TaxID=2663859 RepID=A0A8I0JZS0_9ACTN|nr:MULTISPECIES: hypothetical protein [Aeromicrobium]MBC9225008.1 hypothetical protein [Aeromicrobium senzhongii]MCQ3997119.1 hypothetical protein [Aeromicrobium sp. 636]